MGPDHQGGRVELLSERRARGRGEGATFQWCEFNLEACRVAGEGGNRDQSSFQACKERFPQISVCFLPKGHGLDVLAEQRQRGHPVALLCTCTPCF